MENYEIEIAHFDEEKVDVYSAMKFVVEHVKDRLFKLFTGNIQGQHEDIRYKHHLDPDKIWGGGILFFEDDKLAVKDDSAEYGSVPIAVAQQIAETVRDLVNAGDFPIKITKTVARPTKSMLKNRNWSSEERKFGRN